MASSDAHAQPEEEKLVRHMSNEGRRCISQLLGPHDHLGNDWKLLAEKLGFTAEEIRSLNEEREPVEVMLSKCLGLTIPKLKVYLTNMERLDVVQELEGFEEETLIPSEYKRRQQERGMRNYGQPSTVLPDDEKYDAFICYAPGDLQFAQQILKMLEAAPYHLKLCIDYRDILPGGETLSTTAHVIEKRCLKIIVILSEYFNNDETADFQAKIALNLSPGCRQKRLIPIKYENCTIPTIYRFITHLDYTNPHSQEYLWPNLAKALGYNPK
uniref:MyD88 protein n=1 Tax=Aulactinia veratra TaxID=1730095 RepID=A0A1D6XRK9_AULVR|nr:MyD88 protein [Aulactinia veratra]